MNMSPLVSGANVDLTKNEKIRNYHINNITNLDQKNRKDIIPNVLKENTVVIKLYIHSTVEWQSYSHLYVE